MGMTEEPARMVLLVAGALLVLVGTVGLAQMLSPAPRSRGGRETIRIKERSLMERSRPAQPSPAITGAESHAVDHDARAATSPDAAADAAMVEALGRPH